MYTGPVTWYLAYRSDNNNQSNLIPKKLKVLNLITLKNQFSPIGPILIMPIRIWRPLQKFILLDISRVKIKTEE